MQQKRRAERSCFDFQFDLGFIDEDAASFVEKAKSSETVRKTFLCITLYSVNCVGMPSLVPMVSAGSYVGM